MIDLAADLAAVFGDGALASGWTVIPKSGAAYRLSAMLDIADTDALTGYAQSATPVLHYPTDAAPHLAAGDVVLQANGQRWVVRSAPQRIGDGMLSVAELGVAP